MSTGAHDRRLPPVAQIAVAAMILVVVGGIYVAASLPDLGSSGVALVLLAAALALLVADAVMLSRIRPFAWDTFFLVLRWALLAYAVIAGMLEYVFVLDHTPGRMLLLLTLMLFAFAADIPMLFAFSVARYQTVPTPQVR